MKTCSRSCDAANAGRPAARLLVVLAVIASLFFAGNAFPLENPAAISSPAVETVARRTLEPGMSAPDFALKDINGATFDLKAESAKSHVLLIFFSMFCEPCRRGLDDARRLHGRLGNAKLRVAAVSLDGEPLRGSVSGFARQEGYGFRVLVDETDARNRFRAASLFMVAEIPAVFLIDNSGRIIFAGKGVIPEEEIEKLLPAAKKP